MTTTVKINKVFLPHDFFRKLPNLPVHELTSIMTIKLKKEGIPLLTTVLQAQISGMPTKTMIIIHNYRLDGKTSKDFFMLGVEKIASVLFAKRG